MVKLLIATIALTFANIAVKNTKNNEKNTSHRRSGRQSDYH